MSRSLFFPVLAAVFVCFAALGPASAQTLPAEQEALLSQSEKKAIQEALVWAGHYEARIDGAFGPGTRGAITAFQREQGYRPTGYLRQRHLDRLMEVRDAQTRRFGWEIRRFPDLGMQLGIASALFQPPEATETGLRFRSKDDQPKSELILYSALPMSDARFEKLRAEVVDRAVFSRNTYDADGDGWFVFSGKSDKGVSQYTYIVNRNQGVRGFSFRYLDRHSAELSRLNVAMYNSLEVFPASDQDQTAEKPKEREPAPQSGSGLFTDDELALLDGKDGDKPAPRRRERRSTGFLVNADGAVLTTASAIDGCERVRVNDRIDASISAIDRTHDLALLKVANDGRELPYLKFRGAPIRKGQRMRALFHPRSAGRDLEVEEGKVEALSGPKGDIRHFRVSTDLRRGSRGAPVLDDAGRVSGLVLGRAAPRTVSADEDEAQLPHDERLAVNSFIAQAFLNAHEVKYDIGGDIGGPQKEVPRATRLATLILECTR